MNLELVESKTFDRLTLHGILYTPQSPPACVPPALLFIHGVGYNFYETPLRRVAEYLVERSRACLVTNTRGHDWVANSYRKGGYIGSSFELLEDCLLDIDAALATLQKRGFDDIVIVGHSLGAVKTVFYQSQRASQNVKGIVICSPPKISYACTSSLPEFAQLVATASREAEQGNLEKLLFRKTPFPAYFCARTVLNKYSPEDTANALKHVEKIRCPALLMCGTRDPLVQFAGEIREATSDRRWQHRLIEGADHNYRGHQVEVAEEIAHWLEDTYEMAEIVARAD
ncbi:MAG: alpha/beta fold hydrolase [Chloroflexi bacterium]|nr:alpha/beta fold hydrolase [Chloroflexota bacterium]